MAMDPSNGNGNHNGHDLPTSDNTDSTTPIQYRVNVPHFTLFVTRKYFHYFKVRLIDIHHFFQYKKSWNENYSSAQQIYSDAPTSVALRAAIYAEHTMLYSGRPCRFGNKEGELDRNSTSFFALLDRYQDEPLSSIQRTFHRLRHGESTPAALGKKIRIYTYSLMDDSIRFSRSGVRISIDMASKHALHAGAAPEVFYAGEFWIEYVNGERTLFVDNNSGTFAPPKEDLWRMKELMQHNFPGMTIVTLDYQDPEWKRRRGKE